MEGQDMRALLVQKGLFTALDGEDKMHASLKAEEKTAIIEKAHIVIILSLGDKVLIEVAKETTAKSSWDKLESLYMVKTLANRVYLKQKPYSFRTIDERALFEQIDEFQKIIEDLENMDDQSKIGSEYQALLLLTALPKTYDNVKNALLYGG